MFLRRRRILGALGFFLAGSVTLYAMAGQDWPAFSGLPARYSRDRSSGATVAEEGQPGLAAYKLDAAGGRTQPHPVPALMAEGRKKWAAMQQRQSRKLPAAVSEYKRRYGLAPPDGFDLWFAYARQQGVVLVDEYDELMEALAPLRRLAAGEVRRRADALLRFGHHYQFGGLLVGQRGRKNVQPGEELFGYARQADMKLPTAAKGAGKDEERKEEQAQDKGAKQEQEQAQDKGTNQEQEKAPGKGTKPEKEPAKDKGKRTDREADSDSDKDSDKDSDSDKGKRTDKETDKDGGKGTGKETGKGTVKSAFEEAVDKKRKAEEARWQEERKWSAIEDEAGYRTAGLMRMLEPVKAVLAPTMARWPAFAVPVNEIAEARVVGGDDALWPEAAGLRGEPNTTYTVDDLFHEHRVGSRSLIDNLAKPCGPASNLARLGGGIRFEVGLADAIDADTKPHGEGRLPAFVADPSADNDMCQRPELITVSLLGSRR